jgi:hypothetical protein
MSIAKHYSERIQFAGERVTRHQALHLAISRRGFLQAGVTAFGGALGTGLFTPHPAAAQGVGDVLPIPTTLNFFGVDAHIQAPPLTGADSDPSTVWNFQGSSGIAFIDTTAKQKDRKTGAEKNLDSLFNHMTFLQGVYAGRDGHVRSGTFSLV